MVSKHTPGPAVAKQRGDGSVIMSFGDPVNGPHEQFDFYGSIELAKFIATACNSHGDMLDALKYIAKTWPDDFAARHARAAIAKAEGRA